MLNLTNTNNNDLQLNHNGDAKHIDSSPTNKESIGLDCLNYLPPEVWEIILVEQTHLQDQFNCAYVCPTWRNVLKPTSSIWLFYHVLPIIFNELSTYDIITCRLVCKGWRKSVDHFWERISIEQANDFTLDDRRKYERFRRNCIFRHESKIQAFLIMMDESPGGNPFIGRRVHFIDNDDSGDNYWTTVLELLDKFGHLMKNLRFVFYEMPIRSMFLLHSCLHRVPNVRHLSLSTRGFDEHLELRKTETYTSLKKFLEDNPFPALPQLKQLRLHKIYSLFYEVALGAYYEQLEILDLLFDSQETKKFFRFMRYQIGHGNSVIFPSLKELHICVGSSQDVSLLQYLECPSLKTIRVSPDCPYVGKLCFLKEI